MWCKLRSRRKEYERQSQEIQEFYYKNLCVKEQPKEENKEEEKSPTFSHPNLFDFNFQRGNIMKIHFYFNFERKKK
jgi:hypothetical protein